MSFGSSARREGDESSGERTFEFRDKRRIDPTTGELRDLPQPGSAAADPGNPDNAAQPITATADAAELEAAKQEAAERTADLQRLSAEYANYRKRVDRDKQAATTAGKAAVVTEMLAVLDDLDRAEAHGDLTGGFKNVADKLTDTLGRLGLSHYGAEGDAFDPNIHEAVQFATAPEVSEPTVTTVLRLGYLFDERVLRPAVVVVTGPEHEQEGTDDAGAGADSGAESDAVPDTESGAGSDAGPAAGASGETAPDAGSTAGSDADSARDAGRPGAEAGAGSTDKD